MKTNLVFTFATLLTGFALGLWGATPLKGSFNAKYCDIACRSCALLEEPATYIKRLKTRLVTKPVMKAPIASSPVSTRLVAIKPSALSGVKATAGETVKTPEASSASAVMAASDSLAPDKEQARLYETVKKRIPAYATSDQPIMEAVSQDPEFQRLPLEQRKSLILEIVNGFNRGEFTIEQVIAHRGRN